VTFVFFKLGIQPKDRLIQFFKIWHLIQRPTNLGGPLTSSTC